MQLLDVDPCATVFQACKTGQSHDVRGSERGHANDVGDELDGLEEQSQANHVVIRAEAVRLILRATSRSATKSVARA